MNCLVFYENRGEYRNGLKFWAIRIREPLDAVELGSWRGFFPQTGQIAR